MKVLNFGSCNIDYVYSMDHIVTSGETETTYSLETFPGGKGLNQSIAAARAGAEVYHAGNVGKDGEFLRTILVENAVNVSLLKNIDAKNGHAIIQVGRCGENSIFLYPGSNQMLTKEYIDTVLENFGKDDILLLQNEINCVDYIIEKAFEKGMSIVFNPSPFNEEISKIDLNKVSFIILNEVEARDLSGCEEPEECLDFFKSNYPHLKIMLTLGVNGSMYMDSDTKIYQPAFEVEAVDTTAAGDTFTGFFLSEMLRHGDADKALHTAAVAAGIAVSRKGAEPSIPHIDEVKGLC
jgi:ribokinase